MQNDFKYEYLIKDVPDYPKEGILFKDITPLLADPDGYAAAISAIVEPFREAGITKIVGSEARGFIFGAPAAIALGVGFIPARKPNKLPREVISEEYDLEYGTDELQIHADALTPDDVVLVVDDLIATGGTAIAQGKLVEKCGAKLAGFAFLTELETLPGRFLIGEKFGKDLPVHAVMKF